MASFTYAGSNQPVLAVLPGTIAGLTSANEVNISVGQSSLITGMTALLEVTANVGNKSYVKPAAVGETSLSIQFNTVGDYKVTLTAAGYKPRTYLVKVR
jgi:Flp pilus assembly protein TadG